MMQVFQGVLNFTPETKNYRILRSLASKERFFSIVKFCKVSRKNRRLLFLGESICTLS